MNDIIRSLNIEIAQSLQAGESYTEMAHRIENMGRCIHGYSVPVSFDLLSKR
ncbi:hypothetical protein LSPH24S_07276 [Lysinibacillus sphaericus]